MRIDKVTPQQVELAPRPLIPGVLYVSQKYRVIIHLCCCGCGEKVVTPLSPAEWQLTLHEGVATLQPSIGNATACRSHYWIRQNRVVWVPNMTNQQIALVQERDRASLETMFARRRHGGGQPRSVLHMIGAALRSVWEWLSGRR
jgi:hypothetical protein